MLSSPAEMAACLSPFPASTPSMLERRNTIKKIWSLFYISGMGFLTPWAFSE